MGKLLLIMGDLIMGKSTFANILYKKLITGFNCMNMKILSLRGDCLRQQR